MRVRPPRTMTVRFVFELHEKIERDHPPGSDQRGAMLEACHQLFCAQARLTRLLRQMPAKHDRRRVNLLGRMLTLDAETGGQMSFDALAQKALGRESITDMGVDRLSRTYSEQLRKYPNPNQGRNIAPTGCTRSSCANVHVTSA